MYANELIHIYIHMLLYCTIQIPYCTIYNRRVVHNMCIYIYVYMCMPYHKYYMHTHCHHAWFCCRCRVSSSWTSRRELSSTVMFFKQMSRCYHFSRYFHNLDDVSTLPPERRPLTLLTTTTTLALSRPSAARRLS